MNAFRFGSCLLAVALVAMASGTCEAGHGGIKDIRNRFRSLVGQNEGGLYDGGASASASASAAAQGGYYQHHHQPHHQPHHQVHHQAPAPQYYPRQPVYRGAPAHHAPAYGRYQEYAPEPQYYAPPPVAPMVHAPIPRVAPRFVNHAAPRFVAGSTSSSAALGGGAAAAASSAAGGHHGGSAASSAAAAAGGRHGGAASAGAAAAAAASAASGAAHSAHKPAGHNSHIVDTEEYDEHYNEPETSNTYGAQSGSYANDGKGLETSSYVRNTENVEKHEDGKEDDDHYYNAQSYGKTYDENKHEAYNNDDEDIIHTPTVFRKKKSNTNYVSDFNKARRESGSGVLAHDKHSASYNKNSKKFNENVDQRYRKEGEGLVDSQDYSSENHIDDEDEERMDNHGLGTFVGVDGVHHAKRPAFNAHQAAAAAAAASSSAGAGATSATTAGRR